MEWEAVDSVVCQVECTSIWAVVCLVEVQVEWLSTLTKSSKCLWDSRWGVKAWMTVASKVSWAVVEEVDRIHSVEWVDFNSKEEVQEEVVEHEADQVRLHLICEEYKYCLR